MWLAGYRQTVEGSPFPYHSLAPEIDSALLVRANRERPAVAWKTAVVPAGIQEATVRFVWVFAFDANPEVVPFTLHVNGRAVLTFRNPSPGEAKDWTVEGTGGESLRFKVACRDRFGDPMGFAILRLPTAKLAPGEPVRLRVTSEDRALSVWYMTFEHEVTPEIRVDQHPLIRRAAGESGPMSDAQIRCGDCIRHLLSATDDEIDADH